MSRDPDYHYRLDQGRGKYVLHDKGKPIGKPIDEVAFALDVESGTLHKHGSPEFVQKWLATTQARLRQHGTDVMDGIANDLARFQGRFPRTRSTSA